MATGFGIEPTKSGGVITSGQTAEDTRRVWGALYTDGILRGCEVTTSGSTMTYTVAAGSVVIPYASGQVVPAPFYGGQVTLANGGASSRTDIVWVKQNVFSEDGNSNIVLQAGPTMPSTRCVEVGKFTVPAGITNTNAALRSANRRFAVPLSNGAGVIHQWVDEFTGVHNQNMLRLGHGTVNFATDRRVRMSISSCLYATGATGFSDSKYCEWFFLMNIDGVDHIKQTTPGLHQAWATYNFEFYVNVPAGTHTFHYARGREVGPGTASTVYGTDNAGHIRLGTVFTVEDIGPTV